MAPLHVVIPTHLPRYLDLVLASVARQTRRADNVVITCDTDDPAIGDAIEDACDAYGLRAAWVRRAPHDRERLSQVRNNAVRCLVERLGAESGRIVVLDGDMIASPTLLEDHDRLGRGHPLVYAYRINLDRPTSEALTPADIVRGDAPPPPTPDQLAALAKRHRRYRKHLILRRLRLAPRHKPKLLGGHFSVDVDLYRRLNGFDELFQGWGFKDDEFAFRAARCRARVRVGVRDVIAWHLWHETRQPDKPMRELEPYARFRDRAALPNRAEHGLENPLPQNRVFCTLFAPNASPEEV